MSLGGGESPHKEKVMTESEVIDALAKMLSEANATAAKTAETAADTGACVYTAGSKTYCAVLKKSECDTLKGAWTKDGKCP